MWTQAILLGKKIEQLFKMDNLKNKTNISSKVNCTYYIMRLKILITIDQTFQ